MIIKNSAQLAYALFRMEELAQKSCNAKQARELNALYVAIQTYKRGGNYALH